MNAMDIVEPKPDLFLGRMAGGIVWWTREQDFKFAISNLKSLCACILLWNRTKQSSEVLAVFGLN